jgi:hypothetical protein
MCLTFDERTVVTRKRHRCGWCPDWIEVGERVLYHVGITDDGFDTWYMHPECHAALMERSADEGGGCVYFDLQGQQRGLVEAR